MPLVTFPAKPSSHPRPSFGQSSLVWVSPAQKQQLSFLGVPDMSMHIHLT